MDALDTLDTLDTNKHMVPSPGAPASRYTDQVDVYHTGSKAKRMALQIQQVTKWYRKRKFLLKES